jgi:two-component system sensor histidine kinase DegS
MSAEIGAGDAAGRFDTLHEEAKAAIAYAANTLRTVTERYREVFHENLAGWHEDRDALDHADRRVLTDLRAGAPGANASGAEHVAPADPVTSVEAAEAAAEEGRAAELRRRIALRTSDLGERQAELARLELAVRGLERTWLFLERGDASLLADPAGPDLAHDLQMRIVEAREAERTRLAQEIHDGPAQALANAIFGVEYIEKILDRDRPAARIELRFMRERLRRELGDVRAFISQLRPPILDEVGLDGAIRDAAATLHALTGAAVEVDLAASPDDLGDAEQVVVLRVLQEALQNVRKHAGARHVRLATRRDGNRWILEVRDDGRGFDPDAPAAPGRRTFGLQFMRERAELVRGAFEVRSRPANGTVVVLDVPVPERGGSA